MWRYGRGVFPNRMIDATARRWAQAGPADLASRLRGSVDGRYRFPGAPPAAALAEVVVQAAALINERAELGILGRRFVASVTLIKALGGGCEAPASVATKDQYHQLMPKN